VSFVPRAHRRHLLPCLWLWPTNKTPKGDACKAFVLFWLRLGKTHLTRIAPARGKLIISNLIPVPRPPANHSAVPGPGVHPVNLEWLYGKLKFPVVVEGPRPLSFLVYDLKLREKDYGSFRSPSKHFKPGILKRRDHLHSPIDGSFASTPPGAVVRISARGQYATLGVDHHGKRAKERKLPSFQKFISL